MPVSRRAKLERQCSEYEEERVEREESECIVVDNSSVRLSFEFFWYKWKYPHAWHRFHLLFDGDVIASYDMDTGRILLETAGLRNENLYECSQRLHEQLAHPRLDVEPLLPILHSMPNGEYAVRLFEVEEPHLVDSDSLPGVIAEEGGDPYTYPDPLDRIRQLTATPNLMIPTRRLETCDPQVVWDYECALRNGLRPAVLLFREPYRFAGLGQYHRHLQGTQDDELTKPPHFGFNGNHILLSGRNYYILDGHHRAIAYHNCGVRPPAISITCLRSADAFYPVDRIPAENRVRLWPPSPNALDTQ